MRGAECIELTSAQLVECILEELTITFVLLDTLFGALSDKDKQILLSWSSRTRSTLPGRKVIKSWYVVNNHNKSQLFVEC